MALSVNILRCGFVREVTIVISFLLFCLNVEAQEQFTVYFDFNEASPNADSRERLSNWIVDNPNARVIAIHGFADAADNNTYNTNLSQQRIDAVASALRSGGIVIADDAPLKPYGESKATGEAEKDRKVTIYFVPQALPVMPAEVKVQPRQPLDVSMFITGKHIILRGLLFYPDTDNIVPSSTGVLDELAEIMNKNPALKIVVHGHMCCSPYDRTNLSGDRAKMVYKYLVGRGISRKRIKHEGFGVTRPVHNIPEKNEEERLANRRVEILVVEN